MPLKTCASGNMRKSSSIHSLADSLVSSNNDASHVSLTDIVSLEIAMPSSSITVGQCHLMHGFPDELIKNKEKAKDFAACIMTPEAVDNERIVETLQRRLLAESQGYSLEKLEERRYMRYTEWYKRIRGARRRNQHIKT